MCGTANALCYVNRDGAYCHKLFSTFIPAIKVMLEFGMF